MTHKCKNKQNPYKQSGMFAEDSATTALKKTYKDSNDKMQIPQTIEAYSQLSLSIQNPPPIKN